MSTSNPEESGNVGGTPTTPPVGDTTPEWARRLQQTLEELPGKLRATITDDDKSGIAESVHGLFERSGAFTQPESDNDNPTTEDQEAEEIEAEADRETPPKKGGWMSGLAARFAGDD